MAENIIFAINREYGSGGLEVGGKLSAKLGIALHDSDIVRIAADKSGIQESYFKRVDEKPVDSLLYTLAMHTFSMNTSSNPFDNTVMSDKLFGLQADAIRSLAARESCIFLGRCAGYVLRDMPGCIRVYLNAEWDYRVARIRKLYNLSADDAAKIIKHTDKSRDSYYGYYAGGEWRHCSSYDLSIRTSELGMDKTVDLIIEYAKIRFGEDIFQK